MPGRSPTRIPPRLAWPLLPRRHPSRPGEAQPGPVQPRFTQEVLLGCPRAGAAPRVLI